MHVRHTNAFHAAAPKYEVAWHALIVVTLLLADRLVRACRRA